VKFTVPSGSDQEFFELLEQARGGDQDALGRLIDCCRPYLLKIAHDEGDSTLQPKVGDSDLVQYACLDAVRSFRQFRGRTSREMLGWLRQILLSRLSGVRDHFDADKRGLELPLPSNLNDSRNEALQDSTAPPSEHALRKEEREVMEDALRVLSAPERAVIEMRQKDGLAFAEIARVLRVTEDAARKRWARAIQSLQAEVQRRYGQPSG
jgi:RNA polymerase sigma-70 factor (ECF subfamily)